MTDLELFNKITAAGLTPNQYFAVLFHLLDVKQKSNFNQAVEISRSQREGLLDKSKQPTKKLIETRLFEDLELRFVENDTDEVSLDQKVALYISYFPHGRLPSGAMGKASIPSVKLKFKEFFGQYDYSWEDIYQATENYVTHYANSGYKFMRNALTFIMKDGDSQLALECDALKTNEIKIIDPFSTDI